MRAVVWHGVGDIRLDDVAPEHHRRYVPRLVELVRSGVVEPQTVVTQLEDVSTAIEAYEAFDARRPGRLKVELEPVG